MTRNEKIAEKMGWIIVNGSFHDGRDWRNPQTNVADAHLLIERMVGDGWNVRIYFFRNGTCGAHAVFPHSLNFDTHESINHLTEGHLDAPTAVVELFCRVYGIKED